MALGIRRVCCWSVCVVKWPSHLWCSFYHIYWLIGTGLKRCVVWSVSRFLFRESDVSHWLLIGRYLTYVLFANCHACFLSLLLVCFVYGLCFSFWFFFVCFHRQPSHSNLFQRMTSLSRGSVIKAGLITHTYERCRHKTCSEQSLQPRWYLRAEFGSNACIFFQFFTYIVPTWPF